MTAKVLVAIGTMVSFFFFLAACFISLVWLLGCALGVALIILGIFAENA